MSLNDVEVHIIIHQHWDPAWAFQRKHSVSLLPKLFDEILNKLRKYPSYRFVLDGQTHILKEYLDRLPDDIRKAKELEISRYVKEGRLLIGPFYSQIDWNLTDGEVWIRNLLIGHKDAQKFGNVMKVGWLIDIFGFPGTVPKILKEFDIDAIFFTRGLGVKRDEVKDAYIWESVDGTKVLAIYLLESYRNALRLSKYPELAEYRVKGELKALLPYSATGKTVLLLDGYENLPEADDVIPIVDELNRKGIAKIIISTPEDYAKTILKYKPRLTRIHGYLYHGKYATALRGVFSSRIRLKQRYMKFEKYLIRYIEPLACILWYLGHEHPETLTILWRKLLEIATHDEICGCHIDEVYEDLMNTLNNVENVYNELLKKYLEKLAMYIDTSWIRDGIPVIVFNLSPWERDGVERILIELPENINGLYIEDSEGNRIPIQIGRRFGNRVEIWIKDKIPPLGYKVYKISPNRERSAFKSDISIEDKVVENKYVKVRINDNGTLTIWDKTSGYVYNNLMYLKSEGELGDLYTSCCLENQVYTSIDGKAEIDIVERGPLAVVFRIRKRMVLPEKLLRDKRCRSSNLRDFPFVAYVTIKSESPQIDIDLYINNTVKDHRLRVCFPTGLRTDYVFCREQFDIARFPIEPDTSDYSSKNVCPLKGVLPPQWDTRPADGNVHHGFVDVFDGDKGLCVISRDTYEYWVSRDSNTIEFTLIRGVEWLGIDIPIRAGRAGWEIRTPEAQCLGMHSFKLSIVPHRDDWFSSKLHVKTMNRKLDLFVVQTDIHEGFLPSKLSFIELLSEPREALEIVSIKRCEDSESICIRIFNYLDREVHGVLKTFMNVKRAYLCNLMEKPMKELVVRENTIEFDVKHKDIVTIKLELDKENREINLGLHKHSVKLIPQEIPISEDDERWLSSEIPPLITKEDIEIEESKLRRLIQELEIIKKELNEMERLGLNTSKSIDDMLRYWETKLKMIKIMERIRDTEYSLLLMKKKYIQLYEEDKNLKSEKLKRLQLEIDARAPRLMELRAESQLAHHIVNCLRVLKEND